MVGFLISLPIGHLLEPIDIFLDVREDDKRGKIDSIQQNGVWDCTLCGACSEACPQNIDIKSDILMLRSESSRFGYFDPNFNLMSF